LRFGFPESIQSDNGSHFVNTVINHLNEFLRIKYKRSTPHYPQSNGRVERVVGTIKSMVKIAVDEMSTLTENRKEKCDWVATLSGVLWAYRGTPHSTTKMGPFFLVTGAEMKMPFDNANQVVPEDSEKWGELIALRLRTVSEVVPGIHEARKDYSPPLPPADDYHIGDWVWLRDTKYDVKGLCPVFTPRWTGLYQVWQISDKGSYRLRSHPRFPARRHRVFCATPLTVDVLRHTRIGKCNSRLRNNGHVHAITVSRFSFFWVFFWIFPDSLIFFWKTNYPSCLSGSASI